MDIHIDLKSMQNIMNIMLNELQMIGWMDMQNYLI